MASGITGNACHRVVCVVSLPLRPGLHCLLTHLRAGTLTLQLAARQAQNHRRELHPGFLKRAVLRLGRPLGRPLGHGASCRGKARRGLTACAAISASTSLTLR
jgi:hypothetical protein